jgi:hypothetical protein
MAVTYIYNLLLKCQQLIEYMAWEIVSTKGEKSDGSACRFVRSWKSRDLWLKIHHGRGNDSKKLPIKVQTYQKIAIATTTDIPTQEVLGQGALRGPL